MTVAQLINKLKELPQDANVCLEIFDNYLSYLSHTQHMASNHTADIDVYETADLEVCIQAIN